MKNVHDPTKLTQTILQIDKKNKEVEICSFYEYRLLSYFLYFVAK